MSDTAVDTSDWTHRAACRRMDPATFFPEQGGGIPKHIREICGACPVRGQCLDHALHHEKHGIWAATSSHTRKDLRRARGIRLVTPQTVLYE
jgi:WhiB family transcriptional regulator, redox-sensing transcriptional regulator